MAESCDSIYYEYFGDDGDLYVTMYEGMTQLGTVQIRPVLHCIDTTTEPIMLFQVDDEVEYNLRDAIRHAKFILRERRL